jgi:Tfp pilus assembly pilus retraction ATPase PilT
VGAPPVIVVGGHQHTIDGPAITAQSVEELSQSIANTRQRRELRKRGVAHFMYKYRDVLEVLMCAKMENDCVGIDICLAGPKKEIN